MKMNLKLTADELMNVVDAAMVEASDRGYDPCDEEIVDDMLHIVDAALSAMGIEITEDADTEEVDTFGVPVDYDSDFDEDDEEEDNDPIADMLYDLDDGRTAISFEDACFLMDMIKEIGMDRGLSDEEATEAAKKIFIQIGKDYGIDVVEEEEEEEKKPERGDLDLDNPVAQCVFIHEGKRAIKQSDADEIVQAMTKVVDAHLGFLPDEIKQKIRAEMLLKVFEDNGIEVVLKGE